MSLKCFGFHFSLEQWWRDGEDKELNQIPDIETDTDIDIDGDT